MPLILNGNGSISGTSLQVDSPTFVVDDTNNRVGVGVASPTQPLQVQGNSFLNGEVVVGRTNSTDEGGQISFSRASDNAAYWNIDAFGSTSTPTLRFFNDGTVKMQIDSSGRITTPNQPMFFVYRGAGNTSLSGTGNILVPLDTKSYDVGSNYNASTYRFTAPIDGKYLFTFHLNIYGVTSNTFNAALRINGSTLHYGTRVITSSTGDWNSAVSAVVNLSANDYVEPIAYIGTATASISGGSATWNFFSGFLVG